MLMGAEYTCEKCKPHRSFKAKNQYDTHMRTHEKVKRVKCGWCGQYFDTKDQRIVHAARERAAGRGHRGRP
jgi:transcription elongation factor Elf1